MNVKEVQQDRKKSPFYSRQAELDKANQWHEWKGYSSADLFYSAEFEYFAIRNAATLFDLSPMRKYRISGPDAERYLNRLLTRDVRKLKPGRVGYAVWCDDAGKVLDDGTVFRFGPEAFRQRAEQPVQAADLLDCKDRQHDRTAERQ